MVVHVVVVLCVLHVLLVVLVLVVLSVEHVLLLLDVVLCVLHVLDEDVLLLLVLEDVVLVASHTWYVKLCGNCPALKVPATDSHDCVLPCLVLYILIPMSGSVSVSSL